MFQWADQPLSMPCYGLQRQNNVKVQSIAPNRFKDGIHIKLFLDHFDEVRGKFWFAVYPAPPEVVNMIKTFEVDMYKYLVTLKMWIMDFDLYEKIVCLLGSSALDFNVEEIPRFLVLGLHNFLKANKDLTVDPNVNISSKLERKLLPFQIQGVKFVIKRGGRALIGDEMGCGKVIYIA